MAAIGLRQPEIFTSCCLGSVPGDAFHSYLFHFLFSCQTISSGQGAEARIRTHGGVSGGHSLREHASVFGDLWWPGDALLFRAARGVGAREAYADGSVPFKSTRFFIAGAFVAFMQEIVDIIQDPWRTEWEQFWSVYFGKPGFRAHRTGH